MKIYKDNSKIIHASSVDINGKGVVILGKSGAGKSNLAIKLISMGAKLISDDQNTHSTQLSKTPLNMHIDK